MKPVDRRTFLGTLGAASAFTIVPRRVLGGPGYIAPSDMILLAQVGCGTQAQRQVNTGLVARPDLQFVAVVDPNRDSQDYVDWEEFGNRERIREVPRRPAMGRERHGHPRRAATSRGRSWRPTTGSRIARGGIRVVRGLPRDAREGNRHPGHRQHHARSPARQHQHLGAAEGQGRHLAQAGRERAARSAPCRAGGAREHGAVAPARLQQQRRTATRSRRGSTRASSAPCAKCTTGRTGRSGRRACRSTTRPGRPCPPGFNWALWQGPEPDRPFHPSYTFAVYRGWYAYGTGCLGDMGHYSLWQPYRILNLGVPAFVEARPNNDAFVDAHNVSDGGHVSLVGVSEGQHRALASSRHRGSAVGGHVLVRRRDEAADARGAVRRTARISRTRACCSSATRARSCATSARTSRASFRGSRQKAFEGSMPAPQVDTTTPGRRVGERHPDRRQVARQLRAGRRRWPKP